MSTLVDRLKHVARQLQRSVERGEQSLVLEPGETLQRRHCLRAVAIQLGFRSWTHALDVLERTETIDRGMLMYRDSGGAISNIWSASYDEARAIRSDSGGYLLPYGRQYQVVEAPYIAWLGLDPADPDWDAMGRDWVQPQDADAWTRITGKRIDVVLGDGVELRAGAPGGAAR